MRAENTQPAAGTAELDADLDAAVELIRQAGYAMPGGRQTRTLPEIRLIGLAYDVRAAQRKAEMVETGIEVLVISHGETIRTDLAYWQTEITSRQGALAHAAQHVTTTHEFPGGAQ